MYLQIKGLYGLEGITGVKLFIFFNLTTDNEWKYEVDCQQCAGFRADRELEKKPRVKI